MRHSPIFLRTRPSVYSAARDFRAIPRAVQLTFFGSPVLPRRAFDPQKSPPQAYTDLHTRRLPEDDTPFVHAYNSPAAQTVPNSYDLPAVDSGKPAIARDQNGRHPGYGVPERRRHRTPLDR